MTTFERARDELLPEFRAIARGRLDDIAARWIELERDPATPSLVEELLRQLHSLKGEAKMMGFPDLSALAHRAEDLVVWARTRAPHDVRALGDIMLASTDAMLAIVEKGAPDVIDVAPILERFDLILGDRGARLPASTQAKPSERPPFAGGSAARSEDVLRVDAALVTAVSALASEMIISHNRYSHGLRRIQDDARRLHRTLASLNGSARLEGAEARRLEILRLADEVAEEARELSERVYEGELSARELERHARDLQLFPVRDLFARFPRIVRDRAFAQGKRASVAIRSVDAMFDKRILDLLVDPLAHLICNAVDHGIEGPAERASSGKPEEGTIELSACRDAGSVVITVVDDGHGIDVALVAHRATELGLLAPGAAAPTRAECIDLLFRPGMSISREVTDTSGRGIGLDVVRRRIDMLGGIVQVSTEVGRGTTFELRVPASMILTEVLIVRCAGRLYALPGMAVEGVAVTAEAQIERLHTDVVVRFLNDVVPLRDLAPIFGGPSAGSGSRIVFVRHGAARCAFVFSEVQRTLEVLVKPLGELLEGVPAVTGACVLPDGEIALVLSPAYLVTHAQRASAETVGS